mgnify:CR=1 FL=1
MSDTLIGIILLNALASGVTLVNLIMLRWWLEREMPRRRRKSKKESA